MSLLDNEWVAISTNEPKADNKRVFGRSKSRSVNWPPWIFAHNF